MESDDKTKNAIRMIAETFFQKVGGSYMALINPDLESQTFKDSLGTLLEAAPGVSPAVVAALVCEGHSWRERLIGLALGTAAGLDCTDAILKNLQQPGDMTMAPGLAALAVQRRDNLDEKTLQAVKALDRNLFDGEMGWAVDKFMFHMGRGEDPRGLGPHDGQDFEKQIRYFEWMKNR